MTLGLVGRLFGRGAPAQNELSACRKTASPSPASIPPAPFEPNLLVHRDELLDARTRIAGYRFRPVSADDVLVPSPQAKANALKADNLSIFVQRRTAVVPIKAREWEAADFQQFITPNTIFQIEVPQPGRELDSWRDAVKGVKKSGAKIGLDSVVASSHLSEALQIADAVLVKPSDYSIDGFDRLVTNLRGEFPCLSIIVDGVHTWPEFRACLGMGAHYCLGSFAMTADEEDKTVSISQSRLVLMEMLNMLRGEADLSELASHAKRDPGVVIKILEMANSPLVGLKAPVASIDQAIMVLGREALYRWLAVSLFRTGNGEGRDAALLEMALRRGRFLELCGAEQFSKKECDELFVLGLMSFADKLLGLPLHELFGKMPLPQAIVDALLRNDGPYARHYMLAMASEKGAVESVARLAETLKIGMDEIIARNSAARAWAEQALAAG